MDLNRYGFDEICTEFCLGSNFWIPKFGVQTLNEKSIEIHDKLQGS